MLKRKGAEKFFMVMAFDRLLLKMFYVSQCGWKIDGKMLTSYTLYWHLFSILGVWFTNRIISSDLLVQYNAWL